MAGCECAAAPGVQSCCLTVVWDRTAAKAAGWSMSVASERAMSSQVDAYVGGGGSEWASGDTDPDDDFYVPDGGSDGDDYGADDYY